MPFTHTKIETQKIPCYRLGRCYDIVVVVPYIKIKQDIKTYFLYSMLTWINIKIP